MDNESEDNCVTFIWKIYNFNHCTQKTGGYLRSPSFFVNKSELVVELYPRGTKGTPDCIGIQISRMNTKSDEKISFAFSISTVDRII
ncbi:hypothetical protein JTE90_014296 [Oedothorax gibbosus]|uniref:MATH domain-containing protein n=1 Tax=Oedothorax gibbosus TaxID=931172 RepID=A0AAV6UI87_9ARAC|nr:hypothetical protein JTE90_014296 [Oedothorax gibbosus]